MNQFVLFFMLVVTVDEYLVKHGWLPRMLKYAPEALSAAALVLVVVLGVRNRFRYIRPAYWFMFAALAFMITCGIFANEVDSGPMFAGLRAYLRAIPFFFLPAVYAFSERQVRTQLKFLLMLCLVQLPVAAFQRYATAARGGTTGDETSGTLLLSGILSIVLVAAICVLTGMFLRKRIGLAKYLLLFLLLMIPTTINETKVTLFLFPIGLLIVFLAGSRPGKRIGALVVATCLLGIFGSIFVPIYDQLISKREHATTLGDFFGSRSKFEAYISKKATLGAEKAGRGDALMIPAREMSQDPVRFAFGLGLGNASKSSLGEQFTGAYYTLYAPFLQTAASIFMLELGILGLFMALVINYFIYQDGRYLADHDKGVYGALGVGWTGAAAVIAVGTFYADLTASSVVSYLFWYWSGVVAAQRARLMYQGRR